VTFVHHFVNFVHHYVWFYFVSIVDFDFLSVLVFYSSNFVVNWFDLLIENIGRQEKKSLQLIDATKHIFVITIYLVYLCFFSECVCIYGWLCVCIYQDITHNFDWFYTHKFLISNSCHMVCIEVGDNYFSTLVCIWHAFVSYNILYTAFDIWQLKFNTYSVSSYKCIKFLF